MRLRLVSLAVLLAVFVATTAPSHAQQQKGPEPSATHLAAARDVMIVTGAAATIDRLVQVFASDIRRISVTRPELAKDLDEVLKEIAPEVERQKEQGYAIAARAYAAQMSEQELKDAAAFFRTPAGKKYVEVLPTVTENFVNDITTWSQLVAEYTMTRVRAEMSKRGHQLQ